MRAVVAVIRARVGVALSGAEQRPVERYTQRIATSLADAHRQAALGRALQPDNNIRSRDLRARHVTRTRSECLSIYNLATLFFFAPHRMHIRHGTGSHFVTQRPSNPGIQRPGDPVDPVTQFYNELQMWAYVADKRLQWARGLPVFIAVWRLHASGK